MCPLHPHYERILAKTSLGFWIWSDIYSPGQDWEMWLVFWGRLAGQSLSEMPLWLNPHLVLSDFLPVPKQACIRAIGRQSSKQQQATGRAPFVTWMSLLILQQSAKTILRGTEEKCGSPRVRILSGSRPPLLLHLSESSGDENMNDMTFDSLPSSPSSAMPHSQKLDLLCKWLVLNPCSWRGQSPALQS